MFSTFVDFGTTWLFTVMRIQQFNEILSPDAIFVLITRQLMFLTTVRSQFVQAFQLRFPFDSLYTKQLWQTFSR